MSKILRGKKIYQILNIRLDLPTVENCFGKNSPNGVFRFLNCTVITNIHTRIKKCNYKILLFYICIRQCVVCGGVAVAVVVGIVTKSNIFFNIYIIYCNIKSTLLVCVFRLSGISFRCIFFFFPEPRLYVYNYASCVYIIIIIHLSDTATGRPHTSVIRFTLDRA